jgi:hypothetical protein
MERFANRETAILLQVAMEVWTGSSPQPASTSLSTSASRSLIGQTASHSGLRTFQADKSEEVYTLHRFLMICHVLSSEDLKQRPEVGGQPIQRMLRPSLQQPA